MEPTFLAFATASRPARPTRQWRTPQPRHHAPRDRASPDREVPRGVSPRGEELTGEPSASATGGLSLTGRVLKMAASPAGAGRSRALTSHRDRLTRAGSARAPRSSSARRTPRRSPYGTSDSAGTRSRASASASGPAPPPSPGSPPRDSTPAETARRRTPVGPDRWGCENVAAAVRRSRTQRERTRSRNGSASRFQRRLVRHPGRPRPHSPGLRPRRRARA